MAKKQIIDSLRVKIGKLLLIVVSIYIIYLILFFNLGGTGFMQYLLIGSIISCLVIAFISIKETIIGKIVYSILAVTTFLSLGLLKLIILAQGFIKLLHGL